MQSLETVVLAVGGVFGIALFVVCGACAVIVFIGLFGKRR